MGASRDALRAATIGSPVANNTKIVEFNGKRFQVRALALGRADALEKLCTGKDGKLDTLKMGLKSMIESIYDPETEERVFEAADYEALANRPHNDEMLRVFMSAMGSFGAKPESSEEIEGN